MKFSRFFAILSLFCFSGLLFGANPKIDSDLYNEYLHARGGAVKIIVLMKNFIAFPDLDNSKNLRTKLIKDTLRKNNEIALNQLFNSVQEKFSFSKLPIVNGISLKADKALMLKLASIKVVEKIVFDAPVEAEKVFNVKNVEEYDGEPSYGLITTGIDKVRSIYGLTGKGVIIGHIDTGSDGSHPELAGKIVNYKDFVELANTTPKDTHGHGTHTTATIAGGAVDKLGVGIAPEAKLVVARAIGGSGGVSDLLKAMEWMIDPDGNPATKDTPALVSCSWHSGNVDQTPFYKAIEVWEKANIVPNFSAGNGGPAPKTITHPKEYPGTLTSAAIDSADNIANFSSRGPALYNNQEMKKPEVASPGVDIISAKPGGQYQKMSGTSMAAPHTAGLAALLLQAKPGLTALELRKVLIDSVDDKGDAGYDYVYGYGKINALKAVEMVSISGKVTGTVKNENGGTPVAAKIKIINNGTVFSADKEGKFSFSLKEGDYSAEFSFFGFISATTQFSVKKDQTTEVAVTLKEGNLTAVSGTIADANGAGLKSQLKILNTPLEPILTENGAYSVKLPEGKYRFEVKAFGYEGITTEEKEVTGAALKLDFSLVKLPAILVVDDDTKNNYLSFYTKALDSADIKYKGWDVTTQGELDGSYISQFKVVVWAAGADSFKVLTDANLEGLKQVANLGGRVIFTGANIATYLKGSPLAQSLKIKVIKPTCTSFTVKAFDTDFVLKGDDSANNQGMHDTLDSLDTTLTSVIFNYTGEVTDGAALRTAFGQGFVYTIGFGIEAVNGAANRAEMLKGLIK